MSTKFISEFEFELSAPIDYHKDGLKVECTRLILKAPSSKQQSPVTIIRQSFFRALRSLQGGNDSSSAASREANKEPTAKEIALLMVSSDVDMEIVNAAFKKLLLNGICFLDEGVKLTEHHYDLLSPINDIERLLGEYCKVFILASLMTD